MGNSWVMSKVNSTDGHIQAGGLIIIPEGNRSGAWDVDDATVGDTWELADLSNMVTPGTSSLLAFAQIYATSSEDRAILLTRGYGQAESTSLSYHTMKLYAQLGAANILLGAPIIIYAPGGRFYYRRFSSSFPIAELRMSLWGYWTK